MDVIKEISDCLPQDVRDCLDILKDENKIDGLSEIRLRDGGYQSVVLFGKELVISKDKKVYFLPKEPLFLTSKELSETVFRLCDGSVYSHFDELKNGYISKKGIRIGVSGIGIIKNGAPSGFSKYSCINIRIPRHIEKCSDPIFSHIKEKSLSLVGGILVISPPSGGKTTFLRSFAARLSKGFFDKDGFCRKRVCIIDERGEIFSRDAFDGGLCDFVSFLSKGYSIELATRSLSPQYIVCDEIGNENDALAIYDGAAKGITFVASCHGRSINDVLIKPSMKKLIDSKVFSTACELSCFEGKYSCDIKSFSGE